MITKDEFNRLVKEYRDTPRKLEVRDIKLNRFMVDVPDVASFLSQARELFYEREYAFVSSTNSPVIVDLGANIGMSCLFFAETYPQSQIYAFEADSYIFNFLKGNLLKNKITNVTLFNQAVWIDDSQIQFNSTGTDAGHIDVNSDLGDYVQAINLSTFLDRFSEVELLKMDIEGAENFVLPHIAGHLHKVKQMVIEYHSLTTSKQQLALILSILEENNFRYHMHHINRRLSPLMNREPKGFFDCQLNIFATRNER